MKIWSNYLSCLNLKWPVLSEAPADAVTLEHASILVTKADGETCERCWNVTEEVGQVEEHPTLCTRCATVSKMSIIHI